MGKGENRFKFTERERESPLLHRFWGSKLKLPIEKKKAFPIGHSRIACVCVCIEHHQKRRRRRRWCRNGRCLVVFSLAFSSLCFRTVNQVLCFKKKSGEITRHHQVVVVSFTFSHIRVCFMRSIVLHVYVSLESNRITPHSGFTESHFQFLEKGYTTIFPSFQVPDLTETKVWSICWQRGWCWMLILNMNSSVESIHTHTSLLLCKRRGSKCVCE